jgi:hypothetical protein
MNIGITQKYVLSQHEMKHFCFIMTPHQEKRAHLFGHPRAEGFSGTRIYGTVNIFFPF